DERQRAQRFVERDGLLETRLSQNLVTLRDLRFVPRREPVPQVLQNLLAPLAQLDIGQLAQAGKIGVFADLSKHAGGDLLLVSFDQVNQLSGKHALPPSNSLHIS